MSEQTEKKNQDNTEEIRQRRMQTLIGVWESLQINGVFSDKRLTFSIPLANEVVEHYLADRAVLKLRYHIENRIQLYKIAGLMTASIMRYRPIIPVGDSLQVGRDIFANELLALYHAIAICSEHSDHSYATEVLDEDWFPKWREEMVYFLHFRNHTPESLSMIFMTLMQLKFQDNLLVEHD